MQEDRLRRSPSPGKDGSPPVPGLAGVWVTAGPPCQIGPRPIAWMVTGRLTVGSVAAGPILARPQEATARKTMSMKDVAALGGWGSEAVLRGVYQQADMAGMIEVIEAQAKLREAK